MESWQINKKTSHKDNLLCPKHLCRIKISTDEVKADIMRRLVSVTSDSDSVFSYEKSNPQAASSRADTQSQQSSLRIAQRRRRQSDSLSKHRTMR